MSNETRIDRCGTVLGQNTFATRKHYKVKCTIRMGKRRRMLVTCVSYLICYCTDALLRQPLFEARNPYRYDRTGVPQFLIFKPSIAKRAKPIYLTESRGILDSSLALRTVQGFNLRDIAVLAMKKHDADTYKCMASRCVHRFALLMPPLQAASHVSPDLHIL